MTPDQKAAFDHRRNEVCLRHLRSSPEIRKARRRRRGQRVRALLGSLVAVAIMLVLTKSFMIAMHGPGAYAQIVAPALPAQEGGSLIQTMLMPDPVSSEIAALLRPFLSEEGSVATSISTVPEAPDA
ncbi:MAG: hypothetical protein JJU09_12040 [Rhodobacteraceae bacterium]|nr:hypothetical protein [Paracoccaceae bacterium]TVR45779.1 MAG: hypothetical protein EA386_11670 [Paracoccaceae bacterium]